MSAEGWLLDVHARHDHTGMVVWIVDDGGKAHACEVPWGASLHVHGTHTDLQQLHRWLFQPEIMVRFNIASIETRRVRLNLEHEDAEEVLEIQLEPFFHLKALAEHIEARGDYHRYTLYSVDAHMVQRFLNEHGCEPFSRVSWSPDAPIQLTPVKVTDGEEQPSFCIAQMSVSFADSTFPSLHDAVESIRLKVIQEPGIRKVRRDVNDAVLHRKDFPSLPSMLTAFQAALQHLDPDVLLTYGGDQRLFPQ